MKIKNFVCTQCGAKDFVEEGPDKLRCKYCESLFFMQDETKKSSSGGVTIKKGAKVTFGKMRMSLSEENWKLKTELKSNLMVPSL